MSYYTGVASIIHLSTNADTTNFTYSKVYAGAGGSPVINGVTVVMAAGSTLEIIVKSISSVAGIYVLGHKAQVFTANPNLGGQNT